MQHRQLKKSTDNKKFRAPKTFENTTQPTNKTTETVFHSYHKVYVFTTEAKKILEDSFLNFAINRQHKQYTQKPVTTQKMKLCIKDFFSKYLRKKSLMENFIFCVVCTWLSTGNNHQTVYPFFGGEGEGEFGGMMQLTSWSFEMAAELSIL